MKINFIGNFQNNYVGEIADEVMLADRLEELGNQVLRVPRDIWKAYVDGEWKEEWKDLLPKKADFNIICKWHHFNKADYIQVLKHRSSSPVFYWVWDYMYDETSQDFLDWHKAMAEASDVLLTNEGGLLSGYEVSLIKAYYFPFDVADEKLQVYDIKDFSPAQRIDVAFFGSYLNQGDRVEWLKKINKEIPLTIFSWNYQDWQKEGFTAKPAVYGKEFNLKVAETKINLQFSVNDHTWGYWSNRVGKTLLAGGFLLVRYALGMELFLKDGVAYFNSPEEAIEKIKYYLENEEEREKIRKRGAEIGRQHFTSEQRIKELLIFAENYLKRAVGT